MNKAQENKMLLLLILLVAVGQMTQTIYVPAMTQIASGLMVRPGAVQAVMAAYLLTYGLSQLVYGPLSDRFGRRPMVLSGLLVFVFGCVFALLAPSLDMLVAGSAIQGMGTGVAGVMIRTVPRDLFEGAALRRANSLISMGIIFSPLLAPVLGACCRLTLVGALALCSCCVWGLAYGWRWRPCCLRPVRKRRKTMPWDWCAAIGTCWAMPISSVTC